MSTLLLQLLGHIPGVIYALVVITADDQQAAVEVRLPRPPTQRSNLYGSSIRANMVIASAAAALAVAALIAGLITGGAVNPVRALGPMLVSGNLTNFWVYLLGPVVGGVLAALVYDRFLAKGAAPG